jgi:2',3'-cyclic-nucleotide 2'-phosphodiesterase (5'-nucleotidase family)
LRRERANVILVDSGDLLFSRDSVKNQNARQIGNIKADLYMKAYNLMGYDAFTPGELDLSLGIDDLVKMSKQANFPFLAANLVNAKSNEPVFKPYTIKEVRGMRVGIFGVISNKLSVERAPEENSKYKITDPIEAAQKAMSALKRKCRVIVALAHMDADEQKVLAGKVHGIHFIVNGHLSRAQADPQIVDQTQILIAGSRGEFLGQVDLSREKRRLFSRYHLIPLKTDLKEKPEVLTMVSEYKNQLECALQASTSIELAAKAVSSEEKVVPPLVSFVGDKGCQTCHPKEAEHWATTAHARAYQTLVAKNKASDPTCVPCHTTGFGAQRDPAGKFENVQCESCHGPAEGHPDQRKELEAVEEIECQQCHNANNSPNFNFDKYIKKIVHPK